MVGEISKRFIETARAIVVIVFADDLPRRTNSSLAQLKFKLFVSHHFRTVETILLEITGNDDEIWTQLSTDETRHRCSHSKLPCHVVRRGLKLAFAFDLDRICERTIFYQHALAANSHRNMSKSWIISHLERTTDGSVHLSSAGNARKLLRQTRKMRPYRHDKMFEINHEISPVEINIDRPERYVEGYATTSVKDARISLLVRFETEWTIWSRTISLRCDDDFPGTNRDDWRGHLHRSGIETERTSSRRCCCLRTFESKALFLVESFF